MATLTEIWAAEQANRVLGRVERELPELERRVDDLMRRNGFPVEERPLSEQWVAHNTLHMLSRSDAKVERGEPYTKEQAVDALYWHIGEIIRHIAEEHILDASELRAAIWRRMTLDIAQSRAKLTDLFADFVHVLKARG